MVGSDTVVGPSWEGCSEVTLGAAAVGMSGTIVGGDIEGVGILVVSFPSTLPGSAVGVVSVMGAMEGDDPLLGIMVSTKRHFGSGMVASVTLQTDRNQA